MILVVLSRDDEICVSYVYYQQWWIKMIITGRRWSNCHEWRARGFIGKARDSNGQHSSVDAVDRVQRPCTAPQAQDRLVGDVAEDPLYRLTNCRSARRMKRDTGVTVQRVRVGELWREGVTDGGPMMTDDAIGRRDAMHQRRDVATCSSVHSTPAMQSVTPHPCLALNTTVIGLRHAAVTTASSTNTCA